MEEVYICIDVCIYVYLYVHLDLLSVSIYLCVLASLVFVLVCTRHILTDEGFV